MNLRSPTDFQNGIIDIFKIHKIYDLNIVDCARKGDVSCELDKDIGRKIIKILGNLSPGNNLLIPNTRYTRGLFYTGKYYYVFFKAYNDKKFYFQFSFIVNNSDTLRFIFKYPLNNLKISRTNAYNIEIPIKMNQNLNGVWSLYKFDPAEFINKNLIQFKDFSSLAGITNENTILKTFEAFCSIWIKGVYISNSNFNINNLPKEMGIRTVNNRMAFDIYYYDICHGKIDNIEEAKNEEKKVEIPKTIVKKYETEDFTESINEIKQKNKQLKESEFQRKKDNLLEQTMKKLQNTTYSKPIDEEIIQRQVKGNSNLKEMNNELLKKNMENLNEEYKENKKENLKNLFKKEEHHRTPLLPDPIMHLNYILGYSSQNCPIVKFNNISGDYETNPDKFPDSSPKPEKKNIFFTSGPTLIKYDPENIKQLFYFGHSKPISNFILACKGEIIFSNQEGTNSIIRVWKTDSLRCIKMLTTPFDKVKDMTESKDSKLLCTIGTEQNKESMILWDISSLDDITVVIRQSSPTPINTMKFSPFDNNTLVSCGRENIKFWRIKRDKNTKRPLLLKGSAVVLNQYARNNNFLCLGFNNSMFGDEFSSDKGKVYVGTSLGCVFQVSCGDLKELEAVYKVHDSAILSIAVNEAFCVTGSLDGYTRVWPVDFSEFLIEAKHDSGVCSVDISYDALDILCGTNNGSIGILNMQSKQYRTILRTPPTVIKQLIAHPSGNYLLTIEGDNSVRVWDIEHKSEAFQFLSNKDPPNCIASPEGLIFSCGFVSGIIKVFDLDKTEILYECKPFQSEVKNMAYIQEDKFLIAMSSQGNMSIHDSSSNYIQVKILRIDQPAINTDLSLSIDKNYFATIGPESNCALVWNSNTFGMKNRVPVNNFFIKKLCLINKNLLALILENCSIKFYALSIYEGLFLKELMNIHINSINTLMSSRNYKFLISSGEEGMIKIWDMKMVFKNIQSYQQFIGHSSGVRGVILLENKSLLVSCSENSGIYFWNFLGDVTFTETEISQEFEKLTDIEYLKEEIKKNNLNKNTMGTSFYSQKKLLKIPNQENNTSNIRMKHMEKVYKENSNPAYEIIKKGIQEEKKDSNENTLSMLPLVEDKDNIDISYSNTDFNYTQDQLKNLQLNINEKDLLNKKLLFNVKYLPEKFEQNFNIQKSYKLKNEYCIGLSTNSMNNLVFNKIEKFYAFTCNNKIVIEFLETDRIQKIINDSKDELSCLCISPNANYLISGIGCINKEEYAAIFVYDIKNDFNLKKKLNFHFKGIQKILISPNNKYMISIGSKEEKSICIWNFNNLTVIDSKSIKFSIFDAVIEETNENFLNFVSLSSDVLSFWKMDSNFKLEGFHINFDDITSQKEVDEYMSALAMTPYYNNIKTSFVIIGTSKGNILIIDKQTKTLIRKYIICKFPITKIFFNNGNFIICGEGPIIYYWNFDFNKLNESNVFEFLQSEKSNLLFVDSNVNSIQINNSFTEGLLITDIGSIFFINFLEKSAFKIISSHINCKILSIETDINNQNVLTCGNDNTIRQWTMDTLDQKFSLYKIDETPSKLILNNKENILLSLYENSFIRVYNMSNLKSLGLIQIPNEDISQFDLCLNNNGIILTTNHDKIYLIQIQNWQPLSLLYTDITNNLINYLPKNQNCKSIKSKSISNEKSYVCSCYSDGNVLIFSIEKLNGKIEVNLIDKYNMIEIHMSKTEDNNIKEMYANLSKFKSDYKCSCLFSPTFNGICLSFHECLQFLYIRNFEKNENIKIVPLNYFPYSLDVSDNEKHICVGTKDGLLLYITKNEVSYKGGFNLDIFEGHYDNVDTVKFSHDSLKLFTTSFNEILVWNVKESGNN